PPSAPPAPRGTRRSAAPWPAAAPPRPTAPTPARRARRRRRTRRAGRPCPCCAGSPSPARTPAARGAAARPPRRLARTRSRRATRARRPSAGAGRAGPATSAPTSWPPPRSAPGSAQPCDITHARTHLQSVSHRADTIRHMRSRRSTLAVPGSNPRFIEKAQGLPADEVFLDLEDAVAPSAKEEARKNVIAALNEGDWDGKIRVVRINDLRTHWAYRDVIEVVEGAGAKLDCLMLPKVQEPDDVRWLDRLLTQIETAMGYPVGRIGIEAQIEDARGMTNIDAIAASSPRLETLIFGPGDFMASINMKTLVVGEQPPG